MHKKTGTENPYGYDPESRTVRVGKHDLERPLLMFRTLVSKEEPGSWDHMRDYDLSFERLADAVDAADQALRGSGWKDPDLRLRCTTTEAVYDWPDGAPLRGRDDGHVERSRLRLPCRRCHCGPAEVAVRLQLGGRRGPHRERPAEVPRMPARGPARRRTPPRHLVSNGARRFGIVRYATPPKLHAPGGRRARGARRWSGICDGWTSDPGLVLRGDERSSAPAASQHTDACSAFHHLQTTFPRVEQPSVDQDGRTLPRPERLPPSSDTLVNPGMSNRDPVIRIGGVLLDATVFGRPGRHLTQLFSRDRFDTPHDLGEVNIPVITQEAAVVTVIVEKLLNDIAWPLQ